MLQDMPNPSTLQNPETDPARLAVLRDISGRESATLAELTDRMNDDAERSGLLRRDILAIQRRADPRAESAQAELKIKQADKAVIDGRIADAMQAIEIQRERVQAASRLRRRCEEWLSARSPN